MKPRILFVTLLAVTSVASAAPWMYRGTLNDAGKPANGSYNLRLTLVNEAGTHSVSQPITLVNVAVRDGNFATEVDFGVDLTALSPMKLRTEVSQGGSSFVALGEPTRFDAKSALAGICWDTSGNTVAAGEFLGSTNNAALQFRVRAENALRIEPTTVAGVVNIVAGNAGNFARVGILGGTVSGGGGNGLDNNRVFESFSTVAGGVNNYAGDFAVGIGRIGAATVSGGANNLATGMNSTVGGGSANIAKGLNATVPGGLGNKALGDFSFAAGARAQVREEDFGTFVWSDGSSTSTFSSVDDNQFLIRAFGGVGINTNTLGNAVTLRSSELVVRNGIAGDNADITLMNDTNRGYNVVSVPNGVNAGSFAIGEVDARSSNVGFVNRLLIAPNGDLTISAGAFKPGGGAWFVSSDARLKQDVSGLTGSLERLLQLRGVNFSYRSDAPKSLTAIGPQIGFIAQEVEQVFPQWIGEREGYKTVGIKGFEALTVEALRELRAESAVIDKAQSAELKSLRAENAALKQSDAKLRARLNALEAALRL
jgi:trimeric autotransporter adhesin